MKEPERLYDNFIFFNANPMNRKTTDCVIRAIAKATGKSWRDTFAETAVMAINNNYGIDDKETLNRVLIANGFIEQKIKAEKGSRRITVHELARKYSNSTLVMSVAGHLTCSINGYYYDIWDCGQCAVYKYWVK